MANEAIILVNNTPKTYAQALSEGLRTYSRAEPVFYDKYGIAYDHEINFSYAGGAFSLKLDSLTDNDAIRDIFQLLERRHPAQAKLVEAKYLSAGPGSELKQRRQILHGRHETHGTVLEEFKLYWDTLDLPEKSTLVDTLEELGKFLGVIQTVKDLDTEIFCDCEGNQLGRLGTFSLLQVMMASKDHTWVIDVTQLKDKAFDTRGPGPDGRTLRDIMQNPQILKMFFDVRSDADAFFHHYGIHLRGIIDIQLMELAIRVGDRTRRLGLDVCVAERLMPRMEWHKSAVWRYHKENGKKYCKNSYAAFDERPLLPVLLRYAINDVVLMPALFKHLSGRRGLVDGTSGRGHLGKTLVIEQSKEMVNNSTMSSYDADAPKKDRTLAPFQFERARDADFQRRDWVKRHDEQYGLS